MAVLVVDEFVETVPAAETTTAVSFGFDAPGARPPQTILLAVPPVPGVAWTVDGLAAVIGETLDLAKIRMVDLSSVAWAGRFVPAIYLTDGDVASGLDLPMKDLVTLADAQGRSCSSAIDDHDDDLASAGAAGAGRGPGRRAFAPRCTTRSGCSAVSGRWGSCSERTPPSRSRCVSRPSNIRSAAGARPPGSRPTTTAAAAAGGARRAGAGRARRPCGSGSTRGRGSSNCSPRPASATALRRSPPLIRCPRRALPRTPPRSGCGCSPAPEAADGLAAAEALAADPAGLPADLVQTFVAWARAQTPAGAGDCWVTDRLEYRFRVAAHTDAGELVLAAPSTSAAGSTGTTSTSTPIRRTR